MLEGKTGGEGKMLQSGLLILATVVTAVGGQLFLKAGMQQVGEVNLADLAQLGQSIVKMLSVPAVLFGLFLYALSAFFWLIVLSRLDLSYAYPIISVSYALVPLLAWVFLNEQIPPLRWLGIVIVCIGVIIISRG